MNEIEKINIYIEGVKDFLREKGIKEEYLVFGGEEPDPEKPDRAPTMAFSNFLPNRAMGDWAEETVSKHINEFSAIKSIQYGDNDDRQAGDDGFKEYYLEGKKETRKYGKRPDLLIFQKDTQTPDELSSFSTENSDKFVSKSIAAVEVRSSKHLSDVFAKHKRKLSETKRIPKLEMTLRYTVKVEDLKIVYRWIERQNVPQFYCQVFFDSIYLINVKEIFKIIAEGTGSVIIDKPAASQLKSTIFIPITRGVVIGNVKEAPNFEAKTKISNSGKIDAYVVPVGGKFVLDEKQFLNYIKQ
tara:strand:- start:1022 stop:1918 length:897 start_codon:yes stop_codon:yes gene_type:complete